MSASNRYHDGRPADTQSMVYQMPDQSKSRTPLSTPDIWPPAVASMPACAGDCQQIGGEYCPHPQRCRTDDGAMEMLGGMLCVVCAIFVITGGVWAYFRWAA